MKFCYECGKKLELKLCGDEGMTPFCKRCNQFRFPVFNSAIITVVLYKDLTKVALLQQYGNKANILLAGYITKGETPEQTLVREVKEEIGLDVIDFNYIDSCFSPKRNTLMLGYKSIVENDKFNNLSKEVDKVKWYSLEEAKEAILPDSIAQKLLLKVLNKL